MALRMKRTGIRVPHQISGTSVNYASLIEQAKFLSEMKDAVPEEDEL